jgi:hypothetical protein
MSIFTDRELEFLYSLNMSWSRLYCNELARLLKEDDRCGARQQSDSNFSIRFLKRAAIPWHVYSAPKQRPVVERRIALVAAVGGDAFAARPRLHHGSV